MDLTWLGRATYDVREETINRDFRLWGVAVRRTIQTLSVAIIAFGPWHVRAGTVILQEQREPGNDKPRQTVTLWVDAGKVRVEGDNSGSGKYVLIFDQAKQVTWMVDVPKGTYLEYTAAQLQGMGNQMSDAMKQMEAQLANVPPAQRAMVEQMMRGRMGSMGPAPTTSVREKASGQQVGQFTCTRYEVLTNGELSQEVCAAPASELNLDASALETLRAMSEFFEPLRGRLPQNDNWTPTTSQIPGFSVQTIRYSNSKPISEWSISKITNESIDPTLFTLPPNLKQTQIPQMPPMQ
jgi:hypothetical protein